MNTLALTNLTLFWNDYLGRYGLAHPHKSLSEADVEKMVALQRAADLTSHKTPLPPGPVVGGFGLVEVREGRSEPNREKDQHMPDAPAKKTRAKRRYGVSNAVRKAIADFPGKFTTNGLVSHLAKQGHHYSPQQVAIAVHGLKRHGEIVITREASSTWEGHEYASVKNQKKLIVPEAPPPPAQSDMTPEDALRHRRNVKMAMVKAHETAMRSRLASVMEYFSAEDPNWRQSTGSGAYSNLYTFDSFRIRVTSPKGEVKLSPEPPWWDAEICGAA